jgi:toxin ParE1/3/4
MGFYAETRSLAIEALTLGPADPGVKARPEIGTHSFTLHVARTGQRGRHFVVFRAQADPDRRRIDALRLLHDSME